MYDNEFAELWKKQRSADGLPTYQTNAFDNVTIDYHPGAPNKGKTVYAQQGNNYYDPTTRKYYGNDYISKVLSLGVSRSDLGNFLGYANKFQNMNADPSSIYSSWLSEKNKANQTKIANIESGILDQMSKKFGLNRGY